MAQRNIAISQDGRILAIGREDQTVELLRVLPGDADGGVRLHTVATVPAEGSSGAAAPGVSLSADGGRRE